MKRKNLYLIIQIITGAQTLEYFNAPNKMFYYFFYCEGIETHIVFNKIDSLIKNEVEEENPYTYITKNFDDLVL